MSILTESKYLDELNFASGLIKDEDCADIADWTTDGDTGTGVSSQAFFDGKSCFKMDAVAAGAGNLASRSLDIGSYQTNPNVISIKLYHDTLGTLAGADYFELLAYATGYYLGVRFCSDGLFIYDGAAWNEVGTNLVSQDTWQEWTFSWTQQAAGVVDVYLDGVLQASGVDCSTSSGGTTGTTTMRQYGTTVIGLTYIDWFKAGNAMRYAGETWLMQEGGQLTIRTDTRWHKNSPASMLGTLAGQTVTEGKLIYDGRNVRWLAITSGSGDSPIGTAVTQGGVSGYYLGFWSSLTAAPATAIGATGFIKFREVTGGAFSAGALTFGAGTGAATAAGADVPGWIEIVCDSSILVTVPRLGTHEIRGDWFRLADTDGTVAQTIQVPTNNGGAGTYCPGIWIETDDKNGVYEYWPALNGATNGWAKQHIGGPFGGTDIRQRFVKDVGGGALQIGEAVSLSATYANIAAQASTYAGIAHTCTYAVVSNVCIVTYPTGHLLQTGHIVGVDFTDGGASALDANFTVTVLDAYRYSFALVTADTTGNCTARPGLAIAFNGHSLGVGDTIYCDFTSGGGADGSYEIYALTSAANNYAIKYPTTSAVTSGNVSTYSRYRITSAAHGLAIGNRVYLDFSSGSGVDGTYTIVATATDTFDIIANNGASADSGNVTVKMTIGHIPLSGCKTRIPNVILREAATGTRASNRVAAAATDRPEWLTTSAGAIDIEYAYSTWYHNFTQPYSAKHKNTSYYDLMLIAECATALDIDNLGASMFGALDSLSLSLVSDFAGGTIQNSKIMRGNAPGSGDHAISMSYCKGQTVTNVMGGIIQYARSSGAALGASNCSNLTINDFKAVNNNIVLSMVNGATINDLDYTDAIIGYGKVTSALYAVSVGAGCVDIKIDGMTFGYEGVFANVHPPAGLINPTASTNVICRNIGTFDNPLPCGTFRPNAYAMAVAFASGGNNYNVKLQRIYIDNYARTGLITAINSDKLVSFESISGGRYVYSTMAIYLQLDNGLNSVMKGVRPGANSITGGSSIYGSHFVDYFIGDTMGRYVLPMNEPTAETEGYFSMEAGTRKFNSAGGILMGVVGDEAIWEDPYYRKGHTGFQNTTPTMSGGTITNYTLEYDIDINDGNGFSDAWTTLSGANLSAITIDPALGFKMKIRIVTTTANLTAITFLRIDTISTAAAQEDNLYPLDTVTLSITGLQTGSDVVIYKNSDGSVLASVDANGTTSWNYIYETVQNVDIGVFKAGYIPFYIRNYTLGSANASLPVAQVVDRAYLT